MNPFLDPLLQLSTNSSMQSGVAFNLSVGANIQIYTAHAISNNYSLCCCNNIHVQLSSYGCAYWVPKEFIHTWAIGWPLCDKRWEVGFGLYRGEINYNWGNQPEVECWNLRLVLGLLHTVRAIHQGPISLWVHGYIHGTMHKGHHSSNVQSPLGGYYLYGPV